jgi:hypothetical protein
VWQADGREFPSRVTGPLGGGDAGEAGVLAAAV